MSACIAARADAATGSDDLRARSPSHGAGPCDAGSGALEADSLGDVVAAVVCVAMATTAANGAVYGGAATIDVEELPVVSVAGREGARPTVAGQAKYCPGHDPCAAEAANSAAYRYGEVTARFYYGLNGIAPDLVETGGHTYKVVTDRRGSVRAVIDVVSGDVVQTIDYDAWGRVEFIGGTHPDIQPFGFGGGLYDLETGLVRFGARDYHPETGRWLAPEPTGFAGADNFYIYANGDPVNLIDPDGQVGRVADYVHAAANMELAHFGVGVGYTASSSLQTVCYSLTWAYTYNALLLDLPSICPDIVDEVNTASGADVVVGTDRVGFAAGQWSFFIGELVAGGGGVASKGLGRVRTLVSPGGRAAKGGPRLGIGGSGDTTAGTILREIKHGEKVADIVSEAKSLTFSTGREHALLSLQDGTRVLVQGGEKGMSLGHLPVRRVIGHTHPYHTAPTGPSGADISALQYLGQKSSYLLEHGNLFRFWFP